MIDADDPPRSGASTRALRRPCFLLVSGPQARLRSATQILRSQRPDWMVRWAESAEAALNEFAWYTVDVLVADDTVPGIGGLALLEVVRERHASVARVVCAGDLPALGDHSAIRSAHLVLTKPTPPDELVTALDYGLELRAALCSGRWQDAG